MEGAELLGTLEEGNELLGTLGDTERLGAVEGDELTVTTEGTELTNVYVIYVFSCTSFHPDSVLDSK